MCWADKIVLILLAAVLLLATVIWSGSHDPEWLSAYAAFWPPILFRLFLPLWLFLRVIDWVMGGPRRRRVMW